MFTFSGAERSGAEQPILNQSKQAAQVKQRTWWQKLSYVRVRVVHAFYGTYTRIGYEMRREEKQQSCIYKYMYIVQYLVYIANTQT